MNIVQKCSIIASILGVLLVCAAPSAQQAAASAAAGEERVKVKSVVGKAEVKAPQSPEWKPARINMPLKMGWDLRTFVESAVELEFESGTTLKINENSVVTLSKLYKESQEAGGNSQVKIATGEVWGNVKKLVNKKSTFAFETPTAVASIRGTIVGIKNRGNRDTIECSEGEVEVTHKGSGRTVTITNRQQAVIHPGSDDISVHQLTNTSDPWTGEQTGQAAPPADSGAHPVTLVITTPVSGAVVEATPVTVKGTTEPGAAVTVGEKKVTAGSDGSFSVIVDVIGGTNAIVVTATVGDQSNSTTLLVEYRPKLTMTVKNITNNMEVAVEDLPVDVEVSAGAEYSIFVNKTQAESPVKLKPGQNTIAVTAVDPWGATLTQEFTVKFKKSQGLFLSVTSPKDGAVLTQPSVEVTGATAPGAAVTVNGAPAVVNPTGGFAYKLSLQGAGPEFNIAVKAAYEGQEMSEELTVIYEAAPSAVPLTVISPTDGQTIDTTIIQLRGTTAPGATVTVDGKPVPAANGAFSDMILIPDEPGDFTIEITATLGGKETTVERTVRYEPKRAPLKLELRTPSDGAVIDKSPIRVAGATSPRGRVRVNGMPAAVSPDGSFSYDLVVTERNVGDFPIEVIAANDFDELSKSITVQVGIKSPSINVSKPQVVVSNQSVRASRNDNLTVQVLDRTPNDELTLLVSLNGRSEEQYVLDPNSFARIKLEPGKNTYEAKARDLAGNVSNVVRGERYYLPGPLEIQFNKPNTNPYVVDDLPPMPRGVKAIETDVEIEIEDQIGTVPETILYVRVQGGGQTVQLNKRPNYIYTGKLKLLRGTNQFVVEVEDLAGNKKSQILTITIKD